MECEKCLLLEEEGSDPRIRPVWLRSHQSVAKKVQKRCDFVAVCEKDSAVPLPEAKQESVEFSVAKTGNKALKNVNISGSSQSRPKTSNLRGQTRYSLRKRKNDM